jgi:death on curing protein
VIYLDEEDLAEIAAEVLGGQEVVIRDLGLLAMSAHRPRTNVFGHEPYPGVADKAAALVSLTMNHPLQDGNKRLAFAAAWVFCGLNDQRPQMSQTEATDLVMGVAKGELDIAQVAAVLRAAGVRG